MGHLYKSEDGALWFRSTTFGDDKDRVLVKSNGEYTYFASDVAYHWNKFQRVEHVIDIWGADHHGYIKRVDAACEALGYPGQFEVLLGQLVNLLRGGEAVRMSKRKGTMVTFDELLHEVGADATRYTLVSKSANQMIDFDIDLVKRQDNTNPVYYVQYAHARICSILRRAAGLELEEAAQRGMDVVADAAIGGEADLGLLTQSTELALARKLSEFPGLVADCARDRAPFRMTHYAEDIAEHLDRMASGDVAAEESDDDDDADALLPQAIDLAVELGQISTAMIQRRLKVGYARAGRIIDQMEMRGIISGANGSKPREVYMNRINMTDFE
jgi:arginyl-tRNA synthetase